MLFLSCIKEKRPVRTSRNLSATAGAHGAPGADTPRGRIAELRQTPRRPSCAVIEDYADIDLSSWQDAVLGECFVSGKRVLWVLGPVVR